VRIELLGVDCPVVPGVRVGVQRGRDVVDEHPAAGGELRWTIDAQVVEGAALRGPYVHGRGDARFLYLSWQRSGEMFRRAKLMLDAVPAEVLTAAQESGRLAGRFQLTLPDGSPMCGALRPPAIEWSAG
jgi:Family of unknown function (DUF5990)